MELTLDISNYLQEKKGFRVEFLDDFSGFWFTKDIKTKYFGIVSINIEEFRGKLILTVQRDGIEGFSDEIVDFISIDYNKKNLKKITNLLKNK